MTFEFKQALLTAAIVVAYSMAAIQLVAIGMTMSCGA